MTKEEQILSIAKHIRELRKAKGWTQIDLAQKTKLGQSTISQYELGKRAGYLVELLRVANALGTTMSDLFRIEAEFVSKKKSNS